MKEKLIILTLILVSVLTVFSDSSNFYWYRTSDGSRTKVDVFRPVGGGEDGALLVVVGKSGLFTSNDGINWIKRTVGYDVDGTFYNADKLKAVSGNNNGFTAGGDWGVAGRAYSSDGITWESKRLDNADIHDIIWSEEKGIYVAVSGNDEWGQGSIRSSTDGKEWTDERLENGDYPGFAANGIAYGNGKFVAVGEDRIYTSTTGSSWKQSSGITFGSSDEPRAITYGDGKFVVAGEDAIYYINDNEDPKIMANWTEVYSLPNNMPLNDITWNGALFVAVGRSRGNTKPVLISSDGINWQDADISTTEKYFRSITWSSEFNAFFAISKNPSSGARGRIFKSDENGANWQDLTDQIVIKDENGERVFENNIASIRLEAIYAGQKIESTITDVVFDYSIFATTEGGSFENPAIEITGSSKIVGSVGTNALGTDAIKLTSWPSPRNIISGDLNVGSSANPNDVIYVSGDQIKPEDVVTGHVGTLEEKRKYPTPGFPDFPDLPARPDFSTPWVQGLYYEISEDGYYNNIEVTSSRVLNIDLKGEVREIRVKNLKVEGDIVLKNVGENGQLILYIEDSFTTSGNRNINFPTGDKDHGALLVFYEGATPFGGIDQNNAYQYKIAGTVISQDSEVIIGAGSQFKGHVIVQNAGVSISGSGDVFSGIIYAPNGHVNIANSGTSGTIIGNTIYCTGNVTITENQEANADFPFGIFDIPVN